MAAQSLPSVGRVIHYVSHGTPLREDGSQAFPPACRAAIVTEVDPQDPNRVGLAVLNPTGQFFHPLAAGGCSYDEGAETQGAEDCPAAEQHGNPFRYCSCGWIEAALKGGTWHWPERV
ncbi:hypothetical protein [Streptomyces iakyrus]|uniref:hypothetical protein n=1 Tax=Streptomyces iakyrus TaxID=68219 RepID=UPI0036B1195F